MSTDVATTERYRATGKRKNAVARVTLTPGTGVITCNGRPVEQFFGRAVLVTPARIILSVVLLLVAAVLGCSFSLRRVLRIDPASAIGTTS